MTHAIGMLRLMCVEVQVFVGVCRRDEGYRVWTFGCLGCLAFLSIGDSAAESALWMMDVRVVQSFCL